MGYSKNAQARAPRPLLYSLLVVSSFSAKLLHIWLHAKTVPISSLIIFTPTLFLQDVILAGFARAFLQAGGGLASTILTFIGAFISIVSFFAASSLIGFCYVTGQEIQWEAAGSAVQDPAALHMLTSGLVPVCLSGLILFGISYLLTPILFNKAGAWIATLSQLIYPRNWKAWLLGREIKSASDSEGLIAPVNTQRKGRKCWPVFVVLGLVILTGLLLVRPPLPYNHIAMTLPVAMLGMVHSDSRKCLEATNKFPLPELIEPKYWEKPNGTFNGWAPGPRSQWAEQYEAKRPDWLPRRLPMGFWRWRKHDGDMDFHMRNKKINLDCLAAETYYNPVSDPLRISNLDLDPLPELQKVFDKSGAVITHVVLLSLESMRKELFPIQKPSFLYDETVKSWGDNVPSDLDDRLRSMTRVAAQVTGDRFAPDDDPLKPPPAGNKDDWEDYVPPGMGGINVRGAITGSSLSFKSILGSHCGVGGLTENFLEEVTTDIYQPCIPQIFKLFNNLKGIDFIQEQEIDAADANAPNASSISHDRNDIHKRQWRSVFLQAATDTYDRQDRQNRQIGFDDKIAKSDLEDEDSKFYPPKQATSNYFGYSEKEVYPYMKDMIEQAVANNERLFMSHFTSSTHHPWALPEEFEHVDYLGSHGRHVNLDKFFNVNHFSDVWLGQVLDLLQETGIANETLVVMVGDHGQAFEEDSSTTGTYENPHISNFRVPLVFRHPHLPRVHIDVNATSMNIIPTILDLLVKTRSLDDKDTKAAENLVHEYEGQSLIRPFVTQKNGRQAWNMGLINAGGTLLSVASAAVPYRLVVPLTDSFPYRFTDLEKDPNEKQPLESYSVEELAKKVVKKYGEDAATWLFDANEVGHWWSTEKHRLYHYSEKKKD